MLFGSKQKNNKRWNQRPQLYRGRFFYLKQGLQMFLYVCAVVGVVSLFFYFRNSEALSLKNVEVYGELTHLTQDEVIVLSGLTKKDKLFSVDFSKLRQSILRYPWVESVTLRREFPDTIQIHITERVPVAVLLIENMYLVDAEGHIFKKWNAGDPMDLPVLSGLNSAKIDTYPHLTEFYFVKMFKTFLFLQQQDFFQQHRVSEMHFDPVYGFTVIAEADFGLEIYYGLGHIDKKHQKLEKFKLSKDYSHGAFARLDLDVPGRVIARALKNN